MSELPDEVWRENMAIAAELYALPLNWGYAEAVVTLAGARVVPQHHDLMAGSSAHALYPTLPDPLSRRVYDGGVYDGEGRIARLGVHLKNPARNVPLPRPESDASDALVEGQWLFGGRLARQFGHFLTESLGRLWWAHECKGRQPDGIAYLWYTTIAGNSDHDRMIAPFMRRLWELLGVTAAPLVVVAPTRFRSLVIPSQLKGLTSGQQMAGHPRFRRFVAKLAEHEAVKQGPALERVFVSRSRLGEAHGQMLLEPWLDELFAANGYAVIHPETLPLEEQLSIFNKAQRIVFSEGSALHLYALVARPEQEVGIILRRYPVMRRFREEIAGAGVRTVKEFDAVSALALPLLSASGSQPAWNLKYSDTALDFASLSAQLHAAGFLAARTAVPAPTATALDAAFAPRRASLEASFPDLQFELVPREAVVERLRRTPKGRPAPAPRRSAAKRP
jgi:hypothetical protein